MEKREIHLLTKAERDTVIVALRMLQTVAGQRVHKLVEGETLSSDQIEGFIERLEGGGSRMFFTQDGVDSENALDLITLAADSAAADDLWRKYCTGWSHAEPSTAEIVLYDSQGVVTWTGEELKHVPVAGFVNQ